MDQVPARFNMTGTTTGTGTAVVREGDYSKCADQESLKSCRASREYFLQVELYLLLIDV